MQQASRPGRGRGRPVTDSTYARQEIPEHERLHWQARSARAELEALPPKVRAETIARVQLILSDTDQIRAMPSPLARMARFVYGIELAWLSPEFDIRPEE